MPRGVYVVRFNITGINAIKSLWQIKAGANAALKLLRAVVAQTGSTTSTEIPVQILRKTAAATVTSFTPLLTSPNDAAAQAAGGASATGTNASAEGTDGDVLVDDVWNILTPYVWVPTPDEQVECTPGGIIALKLPTAPASALDLRGYAYFKETP
jgi:hypothetical protein